MNDKKKLKIVIVEDDPYYNKVLSRYVSSVCTTTLINKNEVEIKSYLSAQDCIEQLEDDIDIMILDYFLPDENGEDELNGEDVLQEVKKYCPDCKIIMISAQPDPGIAVELMHKGIYEYVDKNINTGNRVGSIIQKIILRNVNQPEKLLN
ncbi:MAG: response regulator [Bacteroidota bacterium]